MTGWDHEELLQHLERIGPTATQKLCLKRVQRSPITAEALAECELLDLSSVGKEIARHLWDAKKPRNFSDYAGIYVQVNPTAHWDVKIGWLPEIMAPQHITQDDLHYKQLKIFPCADSAEAAALYFHSQGTPYETAVREYVWFCTLIQIWKAVRGLDCPVYAGIARSDVWVELISAPKK